MLQAQAKPTASRFGEGQVGGGYVYGHADYTDSLFNGIGAYADLDFHHGFGVEAEYHYITDLDEYLITETSYEVGARYSHHFGRFQPYAKAMVGRGTFNLLGNTNGYNLYAAGFGTDIRAYKSLNVRFDYELQKWLPGSGSGQTVLPNGLSPTVPSIGIAYHFR